MSNKSAHATIAVFAMAATMVSTSISPAAKAQIPGASPTAAQRPPEQISAREYLNNLHIDPPAHGALIYIAPEKVLSLPGDGPQSASTAHLTLAEIARRSFRKIVVVGGVTAIVPEQMKRIESDIGKANPTVDLRPDQTIKLLMGSFTQDQWRIAGAANGIGLNDLRDDQRVFFDNMLPTTFVVEKHSIDGSGGDTTGSPVHLRDETITVRDRTNIRLRLNREVRYALRSTDGQRQFSAGGDDLNPDPEQPSLHLAYSSRYGSSAPDDALSSSVYGVTIVRMVPNVQKPSQIDYASPKLNALIAVDGYAKDGKVGDLIARINRATGLDIIVDRRLAGYSMYVLGNSVRAGDLLQAIALSATGTYRRIGNTSSYVLASDIEGSGTRLTRIEAWAEQAEADRDLRLSDSMRAAAKQNPLAHITFPPGYALAPSPEQLQRLEREYKSGTSDLEPETNADELSPELHAQVEREAARTHALFGISIDSSKIRLLLVVTTSYLIPGDGTVAGVGANSNLFADLAHAPAEPPTIAAMALPEPVISDKAVQPAQDQKRVLLIAPANVQDAQRMIADAGQHGFTDVWLRVNMWKTAEARAILKAGIAAGTGANVSVSADLALFQTTEPVGEPEKNVFGQTSGAAPHAANWRSLDIDDVAPIVSNLANTPGLAGLALQATAPPGFIRFADNYGIRVQPGGDVGFTDTRRAAFLHEAGMDPIDVHPGGPAFFRLFLTSISLTLPFFPDHGIQHDYRFENGRRVEDPNFRSSQRLWDDFREAENKKLMHALYKSIRAEQAALPLWIDDRTSDFTVVRKTWFGSWDDADRLPDNTAMRNAKATVENAHATSAVCLLRAVAPDAVATGAQPRDSEFMAAASSPASSEGWDGVVLDFFLAKPDEVLQSLRQIPEAKAPAGAPLP